MTVGTGVEYRSAEYYRLVQNGWVVVSGPSPGADGVLWVVMEAGR
jgi:predicted S18 family serine protease